jgi:hypothetical protein
VSVIVATTWLLCGLLLALGVRTLLQAWRTREVPELLVGAFFILLGPSAAVRLTIEQLQPDHARRLVAICSLPVSASMALACLFTYRTFRPGVAWAKALAAIGIASLAAGVWFEVNGLEFSAELEPRLSFLLPRALCLGWGTFEAARYHLMMRRRLKFGLADPVVANRFLLYALWTGSLALIPGFRTCVRLLELAHVEIEWRLPMQLMSVGAAGVMLAAMFLNFWPPQAYLRWLRRGHGGDPS